MREKLTQGRVGFGRIGASIGLLFLPILVVVPQRTDAQWVQTSFADSVAIHSIVAQGSKIFVGCGGSIPLPLAMQHDSTGISPSIEGPAGIAGSGQFGYGVYLSRDSGSTWTSAGLQDKSVFALASIGNVILASTFEGGVYRSTNDGTNWTVSDSGIGNSIVSCFTEGTNSGEGTSIYAGTSSGVCMSEDSGLTWTPISNGIGSSRWVTSIAADGSNLFAEVWMDGGPISLDDLDDLYRSTDYGAHWTTADSIMFFNTLLVQSIAVSGNDVFAGGDGFYLSADGGVTWNRIDSTIQILSLQVIGRNILAGTSNGVYRSIDNGSSWDPLIPGSRIRFP